MKQDTRPIACMTYGQVGDVLMQLAVLDAAVADGRYRSATLIQLAATPVPRLLARAYPITIIDCSSIDHVLRAVPQLIALARMRPVIVPPHSFGRVPAKPLVLARLLGRVLVPHFDYQRPFVENLARAVLERPLAGAELAWRYMDQPDVLARLGVRDHAYAVFHLFAANPMRTLPQERWVVLIRRFHEKTGLRVLLTGSANDRDAAERIASAAGPPCTVACGTLSFEEIASLIARASVFLGVDTGITHLACLSGARVVVVGNRTNPTWLPTYYPGARILTAPEHCVCSGLKSGDCTIATEEGRKFRCMVEIPDNAILTALQERAIYST